MAQQEESQVLENSSHVQHSQSLTYHLCCSMSTCLVEGLSGGLPPSSWAAPSCAPAPNPDWPKQIQTLESKTERTDSLNSLLQGQRPCSNAHGLLHYIHSPFIEVHSLSLSLSSQTWHDLPKICSKMCHVAQTMLRKQRSLKCKTRNKKKLLDQCGRMSSPSSPTLSLHGRQCWILPWPRGKLV